MSYSRHTRLSRALRVLLIAIFALFGGPLPVAAGGQGVICGAGGAARVVAFDFHTGKPAPPSVGVRACDKCLVAAAPPENEIAPPAAPRGVRERVSPLPAITAPTRRVGAAYARGPPVS